MGDTIVVDTNPVHQAGKTITNDAQDLQTKITNAWKDFDNQNMLIPAICLYHDFDSLHTQQEPLLTKAINNRIKIGQTLQTSATLWEFQETVTAKSFNGPNIYAENNYNLSNDNIEPTSLQRPY